MNLKTINMVMVLTLCLISIPLNYAPAVAQASTTPTIYIAPPSITDSSLSPSSSFTISINVLDAVDLYAWQVVLYWDISVLDAIEVVFGGFLDGQPEGSMEMLLIEEGWLAVAEITLGMYPGVDGDGCLCSVTFSVETVGETVLNLDNDFTYYADSLLTLIGDDSGELIKENGFFSNAPIATVDIYPETLNIYSLFARYITVYIELPEGYDVGDIDVSSVKLNSEVQAESRPTKIGDYDKDGIADLMVKFDRTDVVRSILRTGADTFAITGEVGGIPFRGSTLIRVKYK